MNKPFSGRCRRGFNLVELTFSLGIFAMLILLFAAMFPIATRGTGTSRAYAQAALIAQHKIDQMREAGFARLNITSLQSMNIIDTTSNADGTFSFKNVDSVVDNGTKKGFFPAGTVTSIAIGQPLPQLGSSAPPLARAVLVTVTITWPGGGFHGGSFTTSTVIAAR